MRLRLLPLIIVFAFTSVVVKVFDIIQEELNKPQLGISSTIQAVAAEKAKEAPKEEAPPAPEQGDNKDAAKADNNKEGDAKLSPGYSGGGPKELTITNMTDMEKNLLENLAKRRKELEDWSAAIAMKENVLNATEKKINSKMEDLKKLQDQVSALLQQYNAKEDSKVSRLVKIYESMKPQDAANIFEKMDIEILLPVVNKMKEDKAGKILAKMNPARAQEITVRLAKQHLLQQNQDSSANAANQAAPVN